MASCGCLLPALAIILVAALSTTTAQESDSDYVLPDLPPGSIWCYFCDSRNESQTFDCIQDFGLLNFTYKLPLLGQCATGVCSKIDYMKRNRGTGHVRNFTHVIVRGCATDEDKEKIPPESRTIRRQTRDNFCYRHYQYPSADQRFKVKQCLCEEDYCNGNHGNTLELNVVMVAAVVICGLLSRLSKVWPQVSIHKS